MGPQSAVTSSLSPNREPGSKEISPATSTSSRLLPTKQNSASEHIKSKDNTESSQELQSLHITTDESEAVTSITERMSRQSTTIIPPQEDFSLRKDEEDPLQPATSTEAVSHICLCQPDPKIPRPRNAFILYRQHHQQNIISQNRGLSNPEISKIAGQLWQAEPEGVKNTWKAFADEEKARHAQQYPDYRFQPRHKNKISPTSALGGKARCQKCGGQSIAVTSSPLPTPLRSANPNERSVDNKTVTTPQSGLLSSSHKLQGAMFNSHGITNTKDGRYSASGSPTTRRLPDGVIELSDPKRRRYESYGVTVPANRLEVVRVAAPNAQSAISTQPSYSPPRVADPKRGRLLTPPEASFSLRRVSQDQPVGSPPPITPHTVTPIMGPPPRRVASVSRRGGVHTYSATPTTASSQQHGLPYPPTPQARKNSESLRLAPLLSPAAGEHSRSIGAMIMSIPVVGKLGQLRRIAPPIKDPSPDLPSYYARGSIVAVESDSRSVAESMVGQLETFLKRNDEFDVRTISGPPDPGQHCELKDYIDLVSKWHDETKKMTEFVMGIDYQRAEERRASEATAEHRRTPEGSVGPNTNDSTHKVIEEGEIRESEAPREVEAKEQASKIPLLLVSSYILHASNAWSSALPINDVYSPADHWAWTATLWRGIVGTDLTVYVRSVDKERDEPVSAGGATPPAVERKVEVKDDVGAILVKRENGRVDDGAVRRVAFEVGEWVRTQAGKQY